VKRLLVLRHAKSSRDDPALDDHDRPLAKRGWRDAPRMGRLLRERGPLPELLLSSTALRARQTAAAFAEACGYRGELRVVPELYPGDTPTTLDYLRELPERVACVVLVGHNPALEELLHALAGASATLPTAALAHLELDVERWPDVAPGTGRLLDLWRPRDLEP
jgi:phosphohistidine phosphatase